ncbi:MAG: transporter, partial [Usitatibacter sp.]
LGGSHVATASWPDLSSGPLQDNSFLIEEAYNQEEGVVQHINTFQRFRESKDWIYTFTQEWPVGGITHQFSYTIPVVRPGDGTSGIGDIALNYRYQLLGDGEAKVAIAPRFSVIAPSGDEKKGRGLGATSYQANIPLSVVLAPTLVAHTNAGYTWTPRARDGDGNKADLRAWNVGQSFVWLASQRVNLMLEAIYTRGQEVAGAGATNTVKAAYVSPGVRWSYDFASGLQIVPGIAFPIGVGPSRHEKSVFLYLSFEHPFGNKRP